MKFEDLYLIGNIPMAMWKTKLEKLSVVLVGLFITIILLLIYSQLLLAGISVIIFILLCRSWFRFLGEELVISFLKRSGGQCTNDELIREHYEKILSAASRLEKKQIVDIQARVITLVNSNQICAFDKSK